MPDGAVGRKRKVSFGSSLQRIAVAVFHWQLGNRDYVFVFPEGPKLGSAHAPDEEEGKIFFTYLEWNLGCLAKSAEP